MWRTPCTGLCPANLHLAFWRHCLQARRGPTTFGTENLFNRRVTDRLGLRRAIIGKGLGESFEVTLPGLFPAHSADHEYTITKVRLRPNHSSASLPVKG